MIGQKDYIINIKDIVPRIVFKGFQEYLIKKENDTKIIYETDDVYNLEGFLLISDYELIKIELKRNKYDMLDYVLVIKERNDILWN